MDFLPHELRNSSRSDREIVLPLRDAIEAIGFIIENRWGLLGWEGWVEREKGIGHLLDYQGTVSLSPRQGQTWLDFVYWSAGFCLSTMLKDQRRFDNDPNCDGMTLHFCLSCISESDFNAVRRALIP